MNIYNLHNQPESLHKHAIAQETVPKLIWHKYQNNLTKLKDYEDILAKSPEFAFHYAWQVLKKPFPKGEPAIAKDPKYTVKYAEYVLDGPFKLGEPNIAKDVRLSFFYARDVLKGHRFPLAEPLIAKDAHFSVAYNSMLKRMGTE